ncbi:MAG: D-alanyl-D-alanine carboxypeptidase [Candidatus Rokubacteria bacterium]|nr:D-alanyl-D-alanine carboxypeptidase [Candidatus Rokubacteria bacterium]
MPLNGEAVLLTNGEGKVLFARNAGSDHAPASLVKLMTLYLAYEALEAGRVQWDEPVRVTHHAAFTRRHRMGLRTEDAVPFHMLLEGVAIASANDAATAVAERLAGSEERFVERMNAKGRALGLRHTRFANPHGLPDPEQRTTAEDMARLIGRLLDDYPASRILLGGKTFIYRGRVYNRHIPLFEDPGGVQALKTGFTREAGYNLAVAAWRDGQRALAIVLGAPTRRLSFRDAQFLLRFAFNEPAPTLATEPAPRRRPTSSTPPAARKRLRSRTLELPPRSR